MIEIDKKKKKKKKREGEKSKGKYSLRHTSATVDTEVPVSRRGVSKGRKVSEATRFPISILSTA